MTCMRGSWDNILTVATAVASAMGMEPTLEMRQRKRKRFFGDPKQREEGESQDTLFRNRVFNVAFDSVISQLSAL